MNTDPLPDAQTHPTSGDASPIDAGTLFQALYAELHQLAERQLRRGGSELTLGPTTLLHEAYLNFGERSDARFENRATFMGYASRVMRGLIIDYVRHSRAQKRGSGGFAITLSNVAALDHIGAAPDTARLEELSTALDQLASIDAPLAQLVDLHFFCGFTLVEIAAMRGVTDRTVQRDWRNARMLLHQLLTQDQ